ncbi:Retinoid isomerohydrolase [Trichinella papuae]|uniref:Retinoid isomerohydrolase n=1 Tax=Trichinella papuae TaxID=268474 RepID=A0A0V1N6R3_9BILA|nr:Retinoid isomerohydrolase [Trichinella papuae]
MPTPVHYCTGSVSQYCVGLVNMHAAGTTAWLLLLFNVGLMQMETDDVYNGLPTTFQEDVEVDCESENIPSWINGYFVRQMCGSIGNSYSIKYIFDCVGILGIYHIRDSAVKYSTRMYNTRATSCLINGTYNVPAWRTLRSKINKQHYYDCKRKHRSLTDDNPNQGMFAQTDDAVVVHSNLPYMHKINLQNSTSRDWTLLFQNETDDGLIVLYDSDMTIVDSNGTVWGTRLAMIREERDSAQVIRYIYKIEKNSQEMIKVAEIPASTVNASQCILSGEKYTYNGNSLEGMVNSIAVTTNYIIYWQFQSTFNPCPFLKTPDIFPTLPLLDNFDFDSISSHILDIVVISKSDKKVRIFQDTPESQFTGYVINAIETGSDENLQLTIDLMTYHLTYYYDLYTMYQPLKDHFPMETWLTRYILEPSRMDLRRLALSTNFSVMLQFPVINPSYYNNPSYSNFYVLLKAHELHSQVCKFSITNNAAKIEKRWEVPNNPDVYLTEMAFVKHPDCRSEDDGALLVSAFNSTAAKGLLYVLNAKTMVEIGRSVVPIPTPYGFKGMFIANSTSAAFSVFHFYTSILGMLCWYLSEVIQTLLSVQR